MSRFRKKIASNQTIPTAALPDIIFILLFFFMVTTKMRKPGILLEVQVPEASQLQKLDRSLEKIHIYIGKPKSEALGKEMKIQANDQLIAPNEVPNFINEELSKLSLTNGNKQKLEVILEIDKDARMGIVSDVKQKLREVDVLKVNFVAK